MGNYLAPNEEQLYRALGRQYFLDNHPYLLHRTTNQYYTLHKITAHTQPEATNIQQIIEEYSRSHCQSICRLRAHYLIDNRGYCSNEQNYYLMFEGKYNYTIRDQLTRRRSNRFSFSEQETFQIVQTYLCGLRQYNQRFQRNYHQLSLQSIVVDQHGKIVLKDPWLNTDSAQKRHFDTTNNLLQTYPSPEKLHTAFSSKMGVYDQFDSNLFTVGVIGLQMMKVDESSSYYIKKQINIQEVGVRLREIKNNQLRVGLQCLLNLNPDLRKNIFLLWQVENKNQHFIHLFGEDKNSSTPNIRSNVQAQPKLHFQQHDLLADTKKKFTFASSQPKPNIPKQSTRNISPIVKQSTRNISPTLKQGIRNISPIVRTNNSFIQNSVIPIPIQKKQMSVEVKPKILRGPSSSKPPLKIAFQAVPQTSFIDAKPTTMKTRESVSLSSSLITSSAQSIPSTGLISFKDFVAKKMRVQSDGKNHQQSSQNQYVNSSYIQQKAVSNLYGPLLTTQSFSSPTIPLKSVVTFKKSERYSPGKSDENSSISPIFGTTYKQSFMIDDNANHTSDNNSNKIKSGSSSIQNFTKIKQIQVLDEFAPLNNPTSPTIHKVQDKQVIRNEQASPIRNQNQLITDYMIQDSQKAHKQSIPNQTSSIQEQNLDRPSTPTRPTTKHKYNSTIVEIRDQDSIDQSFKSDQHLEEQYVIQEMETGSRYEGFKSNGLRNGIGKFYYTDGGYYDGHWKDNQMDGQGKLYYEGGALAYQGHWAKDEFSGMGKVYNDTPVQFTQPFDYSDFDQLQDYWLFYEGMLMHDAKNGRGKIQLCNGEFFEGDFHLDLIQGFGKFHTLDGRVIEGIWRESKLIKIINNIGQKN